MDGRRFDEIPMQEIIDAAGVSASSFYARFPTKRVLLEALHDRHNARLQVLVRSFGHRCLDRSRPRHEVVRELIQAFFTVQSMSSAQSQAFLPAEVDDPSLGERRHVLVGLVVTGLRDYLLSTATRPTSSGDAMRIEIAIWTTALTVLGALSPPHRFIESIGCAHDDVIDTLATMMNDHFDRVLGPAA